jgi:DNA-binding FrmR family transcriptional regulator
MNNINSQKTKTIIGLKKARGSLDKIVQTLENDGVGESQCFDIIQQNLAVIGLLKSANMMMLENHLTHYIENVNKKNISKKELKQMKDEIVRIVQIAQNK